MKKENKEKLAAKLQKMAKSDVPFWQQLHEGVAYDRDPSTQRNFSKGADKPIYNLSVSRRDITMYVRHGMKPTRSWKVSFVKNYFGIKGSGEKLLNEFMEIYDTVMPLSAPESYAKNNSDKWEALCSGIFLRQYYDGSSDSNYLDEYV